MSEARKEAVIGIGCPRMISAEFVRDIMGWANSSNLYGVGIAWEQTPNRIDWSYSRDPGIVSAHGR